MCEWWFLPVQSLAPGCQNVRLKFEQNIHGRRQLKLISQYFVYHHESSRWCYLFHFAKLIISSFLSVHRKRTAWLTPANHFIPIICQWMLSNLRWPQKGFFKLIWFAFRLLYLFFYSNFVLICFIFTLPWFAIRSDYGFRCFTDLIRNSPNSNIAGAPWLKSLTISYPPQNKATIKTAEDGRSRQRNAERRRNGDHRHQVPQ